VKSELKELFHTVLICVSLHFSSHSNLRFFDTRVRISFGLYVNRGVTAESLSLGQHPVSIRDHQCYLVQQSSG
jgi:hypothetical protein